MAVVYPKPGQEKQIAQRLLALAKDVQDVRTTTDDGFAFLIPDYLLALYETPDVPVDDTDSSPLGEEQARRRPGRPRKIVPPKEGD